MAIEQNTPEMGWLRRCVAIGILRSEAAVYSIETFLLFLTLCPLESSISAAIQGATYRFGPFTIDTDERLLRRDGEVFSLPPKGVEALLLLLNKPGELVTKEDLRERVWLGVFVEENSITQTVSRLRRALAADFPDENPILTVSKRGYRLGIAVTVEALHVAPLAVAAATHAESPSPMAAAADTERVKEFEAPIARTGASPYLRFVRLAIVALVVVATALLLWKHPWRPAAQSSAAPAGRRSIAILGFENLSGRPDDAWLATALSETMYSELLANGTLRVVPNSLVAQVRGATAISSPASTPPAAILAMGKSLNCDLVLRGDYLETGGKLRLDVLVQNTHTGETLGAFSRTDLADHLLPLIALAGEDLRRGLAEQPLSPAQKEEVSASVATNPDALRSYAQGLNLLRSLNAVGAQPYLEASIRLEPDYPLSHMALSTSWSLLGYDARATAEAGRARELTTHLSPEEKLEVEARFYEASTQWDKAAGVYQTLWKQYPDNIEYGLGLGHALIEAGKAQQSLDILARLRGLPSPANVDPRIALMESDAQSDLSNYALAAKAADTAIDSAKMRGNTFVLTRALLQRGSNANHLGDPPKAHAAFFEAEGLARQSGDRGTEVRALVADARLVLQTGDAETAKREDFAALDLARQIGDRYEQISILLDMTQVYRPEGNLTAQKMYAEKALHLAQEIADKDSQAVALLDLGNVLNNLGNVDQARSAYEQCIAMSRASGDRNILSKALGNLAIVAYTHGDLLKARTLLEEGIAVSRALGEKSSVAYKLGQYATVLLYENRLTEARAALTERCAIETQLGAKRELATCQIGMAELAIAEGHPQDAVSPLTSVTEMYKQINPALNAWKMLAEAQLALRNTKAAGEAIDHAEELGRDTKNPAEFSIPMGLITGRYQAARGEDATALRTLKSSLDGATRLKLLPIALRARLYIAEVHSRKNHALATNELRQLAGEAQSSGFLRIAALAKSGEVQITLMKPSSVVAFKR